MDSSDEDTRSDFNNADEIIQKDWQRMKSDLHKDGYRAGIIAGKDLHLQKHFDEAYQISFQHGFKIGQIKGVVEALLENSVDTTSRNKLERLLKQIADEEDAAQRRPILQNENFSDELKSAKDEWEEWCNNMLSKLSEITPEKAKSLEKRWCEV